MLDAEIPGVSYIYPAGAQRGTEVEVRIGGFYLFDKAPLEFMSDSLSASAYTTRLPQTLWFEGPRIAMPASQAKEDYPVDNSASIKVSNDAKAGIHYWRVWTSQGIVPAQSFVVGELPEVVEEEIDGSPVPVDVEIPLTINGRIFPREDVDIWQFKAQKGKSYSIEVMSSRLGYPLDSRIEVLNEAGNIIGQNVDHYENDSFLRFKADRTGTYQVRIYDSQFGGLQNYVYRLTITDGQVVDRMFPYGGQRGTRIDVQLFGQNLEGSPYSVQLADSGDLQEVTLDGGGRFALQLGDHPEYSEPRDELESPSVIPFPAVLNGRIEEPAQRDEWAVQGVAGKSINFDLRAAEFGSSLDSVLELFDSDGKLLTSNDDVTKGVTDSSFSFTFKEDGVYKLVVSERFASRGGENFGYRLTAAEPPAIPSFRLSFSGSELTLVREQTVKFKVTAERLGQLDEEIALDIQGLPSGVTVEGAKIPKGKNETDVTLKCDDKVKIATYDLTVTGAVVRSGDDDALETDLKLSATADWKGFRELKLAVAIPTPFKLFGTFDTNYAHRGSTFEKTLYIERTGYEGPIEISMADKQIRHLQGVTGSKVIVPAGAKQYRYAIQLAPWMQPGRTARMVVCGSAIITDHDGSQHRVSHSSGAQNDQIICFVSPSLSSITSTIESVQYRAGQRQKLPFTVNRGQLKGDALVEIIMPNHLKGVSATPISVPAGQNEGVIEIHFADTENIVLNAPIVLRATLRDGKGIHTAEDKVDLVP